MTLLFEDLAAIFPERKGITDYKMVFTVVSAYADIPQPRGVFIPLYDHSGKLKEALENGATAAVWKKNIPLPSYTPNDFPVFFTNDLWKGLKVMVDQYGEKLNSIDVEKNERTKFIFLDKKSLKEQQNTYDIAVMAKELNKRMQQRNNGGRE